MIILRENTEGEYSGRGDFLFHGDPGRAMALQTSVFSRVVCERIIRYGFELACRTGRSLTSISKGNAMNYSGVFWDEIFNQVAEDYPDVATWNLLVDAAAMLFVRDPARFGVVVTSNLHGDILTDLGVGIAGGMGLAPSANIDPTRRHPSLFECTVRPRTSQAKASRIRWPPFGPRRCCSSTSGIGSGRRGSSARSPAPLPPASPPSTFAAPP